MSDDSHPNERHLTDEEIHALVDAEDDAEALLTAFSERFPAVSMPYTAWRVLAEMIGNELAEARCPSLGVCPMCEAEKGRLN